MSKLYDKKNMPENIRPFDFLEMEIPEKQRKKEFTADSYGKSKAEFIPGGFEFDFEGGLRRDEIMSRSFDEANEIVQKARDTAIQIKEEAKSEGHKQGYEEGYQEGLEKARPVAQSLKAVVDDVTKVRSEFYAQAEKEMIDLVISIANIVIGLEVDRDPSLVKNVVLKAIDELRAKEEMTIKINPEDAAEAKKVLPTLSDEVEDIEKVSFKADPQIARGGCQVETNIGMIDARLEVQLESLRARLHRALDENETRKDEDKGENE